MQLPVAFDSCKSAFNRLLLFSRRKLNVFYVASSDVRRRGIAALPVAEEVGWVIPLGT